MTMHDCFDEDPQSTGNSPYWLDEPSRASVESYYRALAQFWHPVVSLNELQHGLPIGVRLLGRPLVVARLGSSVVVFEDVCCHLQGRLSEGHVEDIACGTSVELALRCPYHGWAFDRLGKCIDIPQLGSEGKIPPSARAVTIPAIERHGLVWACLNTQPGFSIPHVPELLDESLVATSVCYTPDWKASLPRSVLIAVDDYHFPWVHQGVLGVTTDVSAPRRTIELANQDALSVKFTMHQPANISNSRSPHPGTMCPVSYEIHLQPPGTIRMRKLTQYGGIYTLLFFFTPRMWNETGMYWCVARNYMTGPGSEEQIINFERNIQDQDRRIVSSVRPWAHKPMPLKGIDDALIWYLSWLQRHHIPLNV